MTKVVRIVGYTWLALVALSIPISIAGTYMQTGSLNETWLFMAGMLSPFNHIFYGTIFVLGLPGILLVRAAERIERKRTRRTRAAASPVDPVAECGENP